MTTREQENERPDDVVVMRELLEEGDLADGSGRHALVLQLHTFENHGPAVVFHGHPLTHIPRFGRREKLSGNGHEVPELPQGLVEGNGDIRGRGHPCGVRPGVCLNRLEGRPTGADEDPCPILQPRLRRDIDLDRMGPRRQVAENMSAAGLHGRLEIQE